MNLLSFGEIIWDVYQKQCNIGGAPLNLAAHVALQGGNAWLASAVGNDALGKKALKQIRSLDVKTEYISVSCSNATGQCTVSLNENSIPSYKILENTAYDNIVLPAHLHHTFDVISFGTLALRNEQNRKTLESILHNNSFDEIYTDLNIRAPFYSKASINLCLSHATIVKISDEELPLITKTIFGIMPDPIEAAKMISKRYLQIRLILITRGVKGAFCYQCSTGRVYNCAAEPATVISTVGAGDSFGATFLIQYMKTKDIILSMKLAAKVSAFVVSHQEAIPPSTKKFIKSVALYPPHY